MRTNFNTSVVPGPRRTHAKASSEAFAIGFQGVSTGIDRTLDLGGLPVVRRYVSGDSLFADFELRVSSPILTIEENQAVRGGLIFQLDWNTQISRSPIA